MSDLPSSMLAQQAHARPMTGESLEVLGKQAAKYYLSGQGSLTEGVMDTIKQAALSPEQVKRVVEFANIDAFLQEFKKEGQSHRVISFEGGPADYSEIIKDLNDGGSKVLFNKHAADYSAPPTASIELSVRNEEAIGLENAKLAAAFGVEEQALPYAEPLKEAYDLYVKLSAVQEHLISELGAVENQYVETLDSLFNHVKEASFEGLSLGQVVSVWGAVTDNPSFVKAAFQQLSPRLLSNGVFGSKSDIGDSLLKTASVGVVNPEHPLVQDFNEFCHCLNKLAGDRAALAEVSPALADMAKFMKSAGAEGLIPKVLGKAEQLSVGAGKAGRTVGEHLFGAGSKGAERVGNAARVATKYAPHAAGALAAEQGYQEIKNHPVGQAATGFVASRIPYTTSNQMRQYRIQSGQ